MVLTCVFVQAIRQSAHGRLRYSGKCLKKQFRVNFWENKLKLIWMIDLKSLKFISISQGLPRVTRSVSEACRASKL